jgi:hypothetical protein
MKWRSALETGQKRDRAIRLKIGEAKTVAQRKQSQVLQAQRTIQAMSEDADKRRTFVEDVRAGRVNPSKRSGGSGVSDTIGYLELTAGLRRDELNTKRNSSTSSAWVQSLPAVPGPLKRSFWYKMHRRRQQIVLRPTFTSLLSDLKKRLQKDLKNHFAASNVTSDVPHDIVESEFIRAEQKYLLATHPIAPEGGEIPASPSSTSWAEPGTCEIYLR